MIALPVGFRLVALSALAVATHQDARVVYVRTAPQTQFGRADTTVLHLPFLSSFPAERRWVRLPDIVLMGSDRVVQTPTTVRWTSEHPEALEIQDGQRSARALRSDSGYLRLEAGGIAVRMRVVSRDFVPPRGTRLPTDSLKVSNAHFPDTVRCQQPALRVTNYQLQPFTLPYQQQRTPHAFTKVGFAISYAPHLPVEAQWSWAPHVWGSLDGSPRLRYIRGATWKVLDPSAVETRMRLNHLQLRARKPGTTSLQLECGTKKQVIDVQLITFGAPLAH